MDERELGHLRRCVELARQALADGDAPFGSVLVSGAGQILAEDRNRTVTTNDPTAHPELALARWAAANLDQAERAAATVYTSGEHCPMCAAGHAMAGIGRIVYIHSGAQLRRWRHGDQTPPLPVAGLPIQQVAPQVRVQGPVPELLDDIRELHRLALGRDALTENVSPWESIRWPIRTERLLIRPVAAPDVDALFDIRCREDVARFLTARTTARDDLEKALSSPPEDQHTMVIDLDGQVIGDLYLRIEDGWAQTEVADRAKRVQAEVGWTLSPDRQGHGYATEAVTALLRLCFRNLGLRRVLAMCFADNEPSWRLMERLGMRREAHHVAESLHRSGRWLDGYAYAILAEEFSG